MAGTFDTSWFELEKYNSTESFGLREWYRLYCAMPGCMSNKKLNQTAIASFIKERLRESTSSDNEKANDNILNKNGDSIGHVCRTKKHWLIQLNANGINKNQQEKIVNFIQQLLNETTESVAS